MSNSQSDIAPTFEFGKNWQNFISFLNEDRLNLAQNSLSTMLNREDLRNLRFLDAGVGSGLFSLAAQRLDASEVVSFDIDTDSVACARYLMQKYGSSHNWKIMEGSALDKPWLDSLGKFDIVYSWGVLHHTGDMWAALQNIANTVTDNGLLLISIYNDQGLMSRIWTFIKAGYNKSPQPVRLTMLATYHFLVLLYKTISGLVQLKPIRHWYKGSERGMTLWHDTVDWVGGYPFQVARPEQLLRFFRAQGFNLLDMRLKRGSGCNEFLFQKSSSTV